MLIQNSQRMRPVRRLIQVTVQSPLDKTCESITRSSSVPLSASYPFTKILTRCAMKNMHNAFPCLLDHMSVVIYMLPLTEVQQHRSSTFYMLLDGKDGAAQAINS